jgi:rhodanese-related sulfurtransferase
MFNKYAVNGIQANELLAAGTTLVDVRTEPEWQTSHVPGSARVPLDSIQHRRAALARQYAGSEVLVICRSGSRSGRAAAMFRDMGVNAVNVRGGINAWTRNQLPLNKGR